MKISRKLLLLAVMAIAATAMSAAPASAHVEVTDEATTVHCDIVPCELSVGDETNTYITGHSFTGIEVVPFSLCTFTFDAVIGEDGEGQLENQKLMGSSCSHKPCEATATGMQSAKESGNGDPWPIHIREVGEGSGVFELHTVFCLELDANGGLKLNCEITPTIVDDESHDYEFVATDEVCGGPQPAGVRSIEVDTHWNITSGSIEINHGA